MTLRYGIALIVATFTLAPGATADHLVTLYDVDFSRPTHSSDSRPTTGDGPPPRDTVSSIPFGNPIVNQYLTANWLRIAPPGNPYEQVQFDSDFLAPYDRYVVEVDLALPTMEAGSEFSVFIDTPSIRRFTFAPNGFITFSTGVASIPIGQWRESMSTLRVEFDVSTDAMDAWYGNTHILTGSFHDMAGFWSVRLSGSGDDYAVFIDRVLIQGAMNAVPTVERSWSELKADY